MITKEESMSLTARIGRYIAEEAPIIRYTVDELDMNTDRSFWPMPSYGDIHFSVN